MSEFDQAYEHEVKEVRNSLDKISKIAYDLGRFEENRDIINYLKQQADKFEAMRPEPHKDVATTMDIRIHTIRKIVEHLELKGPKR